MQGHRHFDGFCAVAELGILALVSYSNVVRFGVGPHAGAQVFDRLCAVGLLGILERI